MGNPSSFVYSGSWSNFELSDSLKGESTPNLGLFVAEGGLDVNVTLSEL